MDWIENFEKVGKFVHVTGVTVEKGGIITSLAKFIQIPISLVFSFLISSIFICLYCLYELYSDSHRNLVKDISNLLRNT